MKPTLLDGDRVLVDPRGRARVGSIVVVRVEARLVVHRVIGLDGSAPEAVLRMCGDGMARLDPPVARRSILGVAVGLRRGEFEERLDRRRDHVAGVLIARLTRASIPGGDDKRAFAHRVAGRARRSLIRRCARRLWLADSG